MDYIATMWLLDAAPPSTRIYNQPEALRRFNEKVGTSSSSRTRSGLDSCSATPEALLEFAVEVANRDAVGSVKPLTLFGGRGVIRSQVSQGTSAKPQRSNILSARRPRYEAYA